MLVYLCGSDNKKTTERWNNLLSFSSKPSTIITVIIIIMMTTMMIMMMMTTMVMVMTMTGIFSSSHNNKLTVQSYSVLPHLFAFGIIQFFLIAPYNRIEKNEVEWILESRNVKHVKWYIDLLAGALVRRDAVKHHFDMKADVHFPSAFRVFCPTGISPTVNTDCFFGR